MSFRGTLSRLAIDDLDALHGWVEARGGRDVADGYRKRIYASLATLSEFPRRGTARRDLGEGIRSISFERTQVILYRVENDIVTILRVIHGARDVPATFGEG